MAITTHKRILRVWLASILLTALVLIIAVGFILLLHGHWWAVVSMALLSVSIVFLTSYLRWEIVNRLRELARGAESIGMGDLDHRVEMDTDDEFEGLAKSLNLMAERLAISQNDLRHERARAVRAAREAHILYRVSQALVSTLDLQERLSLIAESLAEVCDADRTAIWLVEGGSLVPAASYGLSPDQSEVFSRWEVHMEEATAISREVIRAMSPMIVEDAEKDERVPDELAHSLGLRSVLVVPLVLGEETTGMAITYSSGQLRRFTDYQVNLTKAIAAQASVAISNVRAYQRERRIAETLQRTFLPDVPPSVGDFEIADKYAAASVEAEIGGDTYDLFEISPGRIAVVIADVSGKGLEAGVHTAMLKYMLRAYAVEYDNPVDLVSRLNRAIYRYIGGQMFVTLFYGVLDVEKRQLSYVTAGHELPLLFGEERHICMRFATTGTALGIVEDYPFGMETLEFVPGDVLLLYTDGATDVRRDGEFLGIEGLEQIFCSVAAMDAHEIVEAVDQRIREYAGGDFHDDIALMVLKYRRRPTPVERVITHRR